MTLEQQLIFLFSALGAVNGFLVSGYFLLKQNEKRLSDYFLGGLLLMLSIRIIKSVFLYFNRGLFELFIQVGLTACFLIGPFLYLYIRSLTKPTPALKKYWWVHVLPYALAITAFAAYYSYYDQRPLWQTFIQVIYRQWLLYILAAAYHLRFVFQKVGRRKEALTDEEFWMLSIFTGTAIIWAAYEFSRYTSYIVGALSFTFLGYVSLLLWWYKRSSKSLSTDEPLKYAQSTLSEQDIAHYQQKIQHFVEGEKAYLDPQLTLVKLSKTLAVSRKDLSQIINQTKGYNYSHYIAHLRVQEAQRLLQDPACAHYKISAIAYESGFNSLSSFNNHFKKITGETPAAYRKRGDHCSKNDRSSSGPS